MGRDFFLPGIVRAVCVGPSVGLLEASVQLCLVGAPNLQPGRSCIKHSRQNYSSVKTSHKYTEFQNLVDSSCPLSSKHAVKTPVADPTDPPSKTNDALLQ